jgi:hypothetical protein
VPLNGALASRNPQIMGFQIAQFTQFQLLNPHMAQLAGRTYKFHGMLLSWDLRALRFEICLK